MDTRCEGLCFLFLKKKIFILRRGRGREKRRERERENPRRLCPASAEPNVGLKLTNR